MEKISNALLRNIINISQPNPSYSLKDCCLKAGYKSTTLYNWYRNLKEGKWQAGYSKTHDGTPLSEDVIHDFLKCFVFSHNAQKILKRLVNPKCLKDKYCYAKQLKVLKNIFSKYPNVNFWLYANLGEPKDEVLFYIGKNESNLKKKYVDFSAKDDYTKVEYKYQPEERASQIKVKKNLWDYY